MAFDREEFLAWLPLNGVMSSADDYVASLRTMESNYGWDLNALLPDGADAADAQLTSEIAALNVATQRRQRALVFNLRSALRSYDEYIRDRAGIARRLIRGRRARRG